MGGTISVQATPAKEMTGIIKQDPCAHLDGAPYVACLDAQKKLAAGPSETPAAIGFEVATASSSIPADASAAQWLKDNSATATKEQLIKACTVAFPQAVDKCLEETANMRITGGSPRQEDAVVGSIVGLGRIEQGVSSFCSEGSACAAPVYGKPAWTWGLAALVILLAAWGVDDA
jgi:hypothetical protein